MVRIGRALRLVVLVDVEGDRLQVRVPEGDVRVVAVRALDEGRAVAVNRPVHCRHHLVVDVLVVPQAVLVGDPRVGVFVAEDDLRVVPVDDLVGVGNLVGVGVGAQEESQVRGGHPLG